MPPKKKFEKALGENEFRTRYLPHISQLPSVLARRKKKYKLFGLNLKFIYGVEMKISNFQNFSMRAKSEIDRFVFSLC